MEQKKNKIKSLLQQSLLECGKEKEFKPIRDAIEEIISALDNNDKINKNLSQMLDLAKKNQEKWWDAVKLGMKSIKKDKK